MPDSQTVATVRVTTIGLEGHLRCPPDPAGLIVFAHGAGSSHRSPRNNRVAGALAAQGFATLLFDLLTEDEAQDRANVFDIPLLGQRMLDALDWTWSQRPLRRLPVGLFGASTGAAAALVAAAQAPDRVGAVVSRGGRPDLAAGALPQVRAPVLLIVGGLDEVVVHLNLTAADRLTCPHRTEIVPGATHLFEEPGALDRVTTLAGDWFTQHLSHAESRA
ncbi:dienelactone hydrolase family protein [Thetidibacter halocola]|uniref:Dienelactone hydrolase family protein n=1 Tax=Thetidibacter halocola TaxID=2827239 RepID=A0A8J7WC15_9RHOB|nr:alpha/beta fold hydrolase [Thetidibacter halocola]MBS0122931.1 dienelactone hydrolase family protein [Thetidibacter halocola]